MPTVNCEAERINEHLCCNNWQQLLSYDLCAEDQCGPSLPNCSDLLSLYCLPILYSTTLFTVTHCRWSSALLQDHSLSSASLWCHITPQAGVCVCVWERETTYVYFCFVLLNKINENGGFWQLFSLAACRFWLHKPHTQQISSFSGLSLLSLPAPSSPLFSFPSLFLSSPIFFIFMYPFSLFCLSSCPPSILPSLTVTVIVRSFHPPHAVFFLLLRHFSAITLSLKMHLSCP